MIINTYNPEDMSLVESCATGVDFGDVVKTQHSAVSIVLKPELESGDSFSTLALFLENNGGLGSTQFGKYMSADPAIGILPGSDYLSDHFTVQEGISDFINFELTSDMGLVLDTDEPEYIWLDTQVGSAADSGAAQVNFRFVFEYF
jgi:hypothetical protein